MRHSSPPTTRNSISINYSPHKAPLAGSNLIALIYYCAGESISSIDVPPTLPSLRSARWGLSIAYGTRFSNGYHLIILCLYVLLVYISLSFFPRRDATLASPSAVVGEG